MEQSNTEFKALREDLNARGVPQQSEMRVRLWYPTDSQYACCTDVENTLKSRAMFSKPPRQILILNALAQVMLRPTWADRSYSR